MFSACSRRRFLHESSRLLATGSLAGFGSTVLSAQDDARPPPLDAGLAREVVVASHRDLDRVRELVARHPTLVNASWDWGAGDYETPLQATAHIGQREIAEFLLAHGARPDLFAAAMLGHLDVIREAFIVNPTIARVHGPHGFTLYHCAMRGGEQAQPVVQFLLAQGVTTETWRALPGG